MNIFKFSINKILFTLFILLFFSNIKASVFIIKDEFGHPVNHSYIISKDKYQLKENKLTINSNFIVFSKDFLPQFIINNQKKLRTIYLKKRKKLSVKIDSIEPIYAIIKHKNSGKFFEKYEITKPYFLPEITENEKLFIYKPGSYPIIFFQFNNFPKQINFENADNYCQIKIENNMENKTLFENNITPDGYLAFKNGTILKVNGYVYEILDKNIEIGSVKSLKKEALITFKKNCNIDFVIQKNGKTMKNYMYNVENNKIKGLAPGNYTFVAKFGEIACEYFSNIFVSESGYDLGEINCETAELSIIVKNENGEKIENAVVDIYPKLQSNKITDKTGTVKFKLKIPRPIKIMVKHRNYAPFTSERFQFNSDLTYPITLTHGSTLTLEYDHPKNKIVVRGFGIKNRHGLSFKLENELYTSINIPPDTYKINFTDFDTNFTKKLSLEVEEGEDYFINLNGGGITLSGKIKPQLPDDFEGKMRLKSKNQTINIPIEKDSTFFIENITFGTYTAFLKTNKENVITVIENIIIDENTDELTINLPGKFWSGFIKTESSDIQESVIINMYDNTGKLKWYFHVNSGVNQLFIPENCDYLVIKYGNLKKRISSNDLFSLDNIILE